MISFVGRLINRSACLHFKVSWGVATRSTKHAQAAQKEIVLNNEKLNFPFR